MKTCSAYCSMDAMKTRTRILLCLLVRQGKNLKRIEHNFILRRQIVLRSQCLPRVMRFLDLIVLIEHCSQLLCKITDNSGTLRKEDYEAYHKELSETVGVQKEIMQDAKEQVGSVARSLLGSNDVSENSTSSSSAMSPEVDLSK